MTLETAQERVQFLKVGLSEKEIEHLYIAWNKIEVVGVDWQDGRE